MGRLWVADHQTLEIEVAVKLLNPELAQDVQWLVRFRHEAHTIAKIDSAHVVRVFDHGTTFDNEPFIVMELLRGEDLLQRIERTNGLPLEEVLLIVSQICKALSRAHAVGIVHRDLKPENIFLTTEGGELFVKLLDFGIAKHANAKSMRLTDVTSVFGTPLYMSPEQSLSASNVDHRADLWALAVVTFQMLTGVCPFVGPTPAAIGMKVQAGDFGLPSEMRPGLPRSVDRWFKRALCRDIEARFASADELLSAFRRALHLRGTQVVPSVPAATRHDQTMVQAASAVTPSPALEVMPRRTRQWLAGIATALSIIGVGAALGFLVSRGGHSRRGTATPHASPGISAAETNTVRSPPFGATLAHREAPAQTENRAAEAEPAQAGHDPPPAAPAPLDAGSAPPAKAAPRAVRGRNVPLAPATTSPTAEEKPIKDRGF